MENKKNKSLGISLYILTIFLGAVIWGVLYALGLFAAIISLATAYVAVLVYDKFCELNKKIYTITGVLITIFNVIAMFIAIPVATAIQAEVSLALAFQVMIQMMDQIIVDMAVDIMLCIAFTILGLIGFKKFYEDKKVAREQRKQANETIETIVDAPAIQTETSANDVQGETTVNAEPNDNALNEEQSGESVQSEEPENNEEVQSSIQEDFIKTEKTDDLPAETDNTDNK